MKLIQLPAEDPEAVRTRDGAHLNEPVRRRPRGFSQVGKSGGFVDAQFEAEQRSARFARA